MFRAALPLGVDPCGERGEYHSFVFDGPLFRRPVGFRLGDVSLQAPFAFQELVAATQDLGSEGQPRRSAGVPPGAPGADPGDGG